MSKVLQRMGSWMALMGLVALATGCIGPRFISNASSQNDEVKFVYYQQMPFQAEQGVVKCKVAENGDLTNCRKMKITLDGEGLP